MFPNSNNARNPNPGHFNSFGRRKPELINIYALPLPGSDTMSKKERNAMKRTADFFPFPFPFPADNSNNVGGKKPRFNQDFVPNEKNFNQNKKNRKQAKKQNRFPSQEHIYKKIVDYESTNQIFNLPLPKDESSDLEQDTPVIDFSHLIKDIPLSELGSITKIDDEIRKTVDSVSLPDSTYQATWNKILDDLNASFAIKGCTNKWNLFGSYLYGLVDKDSDIDIYYECENDDPAAALPQSIPANMKKKLQKSKKFFRVTFIKNARVPVLRATHYESRKQVDISFSHDLGVRNSLLTKLYVKMNPDLKYLTLYLKEILRKYQTLGTGRITTHILFWLVGFFMQQKKLLPAVIDVRKSSKTKQESAGWDCSLPEDYSYPVEPVSLYSLMLQFFAFYKDFDFLNYVISPFSGRAFLLRDFERLRIPADEFSTYLRRLENPEQSSYSRCVMNLQDPSDLGFNLAKQVTVYNANKFKIICHCLSNLLPTSGEVASLNDLLPESLDFDHYEAYNLVQYCNRALQSTSLAEHCAGKLNNDYVLEAMRKLMEKVFDFEKVNITVAPNLPHIHFNDGKLVKNTASVVYYEYRSTERTWNNDFIKDIIPRKEGDTEPVKVFLTSDFCTERNVIRYFFQSQFNFIRFLSQHGTQLLSLALNEVIPNPNP